MGHKAVPYDEIRALVKSLQPDCLLADHTHMAEPWNVDIVNFEDGKMKVATFTPTAARYVKLEARAAANGTAAVTEITVGGKP